jgi:hypothetical protein
VKSRATPRFWASYRDLPTEIKEAARKAYRLSREDPSIQACSSRRFTSASLSTLFASPSDIVPSGSWKVTRSPGSG